MQIIPDSTAEILRMERPPQRQRVKSAKQTCSKVQTTNANRLQQRAGRAQFANVDPQIIMASSDKNFQEKTKTFD